MSALTGGYNSADVATATTVSASLAAVDFAANAGTSLANYALPTTASGAGAINPATLTAAIAGNPTKTYDGTITAALVSGNFALSGFAGGQGATVSALTGSYNSADVATATTVSATLAAADFAGNAGTSLGNYTLPISASGAGAITPAALTITADNATKSFGTAIVLAPTAFTANSRLVAGDTVTSVALASAGTAAAAPVAGSPYTITAGSAAGTGLSNYTITYATGLLTVTTAGLTVTADNQTRTVGEANPPLTFTITAGNLFGGDTLSGAPFTAATPASIAGAYPITEGTVAATANYALTFVNGTLTVTTVNPGASPVLLVTTPSGSGTPPGTNLTAPTSCSGAGDHLAAKEHWRGGDLWQRRLRRIVAPLRRGGGRFRRGKKRT